MCIRDRMTDMDGNFHLEVTDKKVTLMVSYIGYTSQEVVATPVSYTHLSVAIRLYLVLR